MIGNTDQTYGSISKFFHWIVAFSIVFLIGLGLYMHELPLGSAEEVERKLWFYSLHKSVGMLTFVVAILRILWAFNQPKPRPVRGGKPYEHWLAELVHFVLYGALVVMPISGWLHHAATRGFAPIWLSFPQGAAFIPESQSLAELFSWVHFFAGVLLVIAIALHVAGAMKHFFIDHDGTLQRMLPLISAHDTATEAKTKRTGPPAFWIALALYAMVLVAAVVYPQNVSQITKETKAETANDQLQSNWLVDYQKSTLAVTIGQSGAPTEGKFNSWTASIQFDPDNLKDARVEAVINIDSLELGSVSDQAKSADFLNGPQFPTAQFISQNFEKTGEADFVAHGMLTIAGVTQPYDLPFHLVIDGNKAVMTSVSSINRMDFGVGKVGFGDESGVDFTVKVDIKLVATKN